MSMQLETSWFANSSLSNISEFIFYAIWEPNTLMIRIDANGGIADISLIQVRYGEKCNLSEAFVSRDYYNLKGWNLYRPADNKWFAAGEGWYTEAEIASKGYTKCLYDPNLSMTLESSWFRNTSVSDISEFIFYAIWEQICADSHNYSATVTAPTCTEKGYTTHFCTVCGDSYVDSYTDALGHAWDNGVVTKQPTETENGIRTLTCIRCNATKTETIPATGDKPCDGGEGCPSSKFVDVNPKQWYHPYVDYAVTHGLFSGTSKNTFEPEAAMTRAMLVTVLWRYEGQPKGYQKTFTDVNAKTGSWYIDAVAWAAANGVVKGVGDGKFDPHGKITREQMATILFRYAQKKGIDTSKRGDLGAFPDATLVSTYAKDAMQWAVAEKIIKGSDGKILPKGNATRAQVATILMRYIKNIVNK